MTKLKIAQFKNGLSKYLRQVRRGGEIIVMDRDTPVAKVVPFTTAKTAKAAAGLTVISADRPAKDLNKIHRVRPKIKFDAVKYLQEDREDKC